MKNYRELQVGDNVRILSGPRKGKLAEVTQVTMVGVYVHPFFMYDGQVEYVTREEAFLYKLENA